MNETNASVIKFVKPDSQALLLALIALIALFQTIQLLRVSLAATSLTLQPGSSVNSTGTPGEPSSMVGGC